MTDELKLNLKSISVSDEKKAQMKQLFPEIFTENKIDFERLKSVLGESIEASKERYGMTWAGKSNCFKIIQESSAGTLKIDRDESVNFDNTENVFIEGDNLEVIKILQKSYYGKVKVIYIDPPYNTGNEFVYPDNFSESLETYLKYTGQKDTEGKKFSTNMESDGRFHSKWMNMMYPRLYLSRNLLREDGLIFISIDDNEIGNLRKLCDEIFGEENFIGQISRATGTRMGTGSRGLSKELDYLLVYTKSTETNLSKLPMTASELAIYDQEDSRGKYLCRSMRRTGGENRREDRPSMYYPVKAPDGTEVFPIAPEGYESRWVCGKDTYVELVASGEIEWKKVKKNGEERWQVYQKHYLNDGIKETSNLWVGDDGNKKATKELSALFKSEKVFDHPKPVTIMQKIIQMSTEPNKGHIVLDFFAGSCTTGHAVMALNSEDGGNRKFILVQIPERIDESASAFKVGFHTIAEIGKERIRGVIKKIKEEKTETKADLGFKVLKLSQSNFKIWETGHDQNVASSLKLYADHIDHNAKPEDILCEILLKSGFELTTKVEKIKIDKKDVFSIEDGAMFVYLGDGITKELTYAIADSGSKYFICLDHSFHHNDQLKTNTVQLMKSRNIEFRTV